MGTVNTATTLSSLFKEVYAPNIEGLVPETAYIIRNTTLRDADRIGKKWIVPVVVSNEGGATFAAAAAGAFALNDAIAMTMVSAEVVSSQIMLRSQIDYELSARATQGPRSFDRAMRVVVKSNLENISKLQEIAFLYGGKGLGTVDASVNVDATTTTVEFSSWAAGIWIGQIGHKLQFYSSADVLVEDGGSSIFVIKSIDAVNKKITVTGDAVDIAELDAVIATPDTVTPYWYGAHGKECAGLDKIITNTGTLFGIDAGTYDTWKGQTYAVGGAFDFEKYTTGLSLAVNYGLNEDVVLMLPPKTWTALNADLAALRSYDSSYKDGQAKLGNREIVYYSQNGTTTIVPYSLVKEGEAFAVPMSRVRRIGASEITFNNPANNQEFFIELQSNAGFELRSYSNQAILVDRPAWCVKFTGITN